MGFERAMVKFREISFEGGELKIGECDNCDLGGLEASCRFYYFCISCDLCANC